MRTETRDRLRDVLGPNRRNLGALALVAAILVATHVAPVRNLQYAGWLAVFSVWMAWFVLVCVEWLGLVED